MQLTNLLNFSDSIKIVQGDKNIDITHLTSDSRDVQQGSLFAAISGEKVDGHKFINSAISKGAIAILTDGRDVEVPKTISVLTANNVRREFAKACARFWSLRPNFLVGVTGTNGKTSTVEFLRQIWERNTWNAVSLGTLGVRTSSKLNLPFSGLTTPSSEYLFSALNIFCKNNISYVAIEASSHGLEQDRMTGLNFQVAIFTNLGRDHLDYHKNSESYFKSKEKLFLNYLQDGGQAVINIDDCYGRKLIQNLKNRPINIKTFGEHVDADFRIESIKPTNVCNQEKNALNRVRGSNTNLSKNYYQTSQQYRHSRCNTIQQKGYQYSNSGNGEYVSNCSNEGCNKVIYKPSNSQFATQGGVSSSSRTSRLTLNTIKTEANNYKNKATADNYTNIGSVVTTPFILKAKTSGLQICKPSKICS